MSDAECEWLRSTVARLRTAADDLLDARGPSAIQAKAAALRAVLDVTLHIDPPDGVAAGPQATPQVLWEGDLGELMYAVNGTPVMSALVDAFPEDEPDQWQVRIQRVVAAPTSQEDA